MGWFNKVLHGVAARRSAEKKYLLGAMEASADEPLATVGNDDAKRKRPPRAPPH
jgi:hypothetical protein